MGVLYPDAMVGRLEGRLLGFSQKSEKALGTKRLEKPKNGCLVLYEAGPRDMSSLSLWKAPRLVFIFSSYKAQNGVP